jgi:hypothetical protein
VAITSAWMAPHSVLILQDRRGQGKHQGKGTYPVTWDDPEQWQNSKCGQSHLWISHFPSKAGPDHMSKKARSRWGLRVLRVHTAQPHGRLPSCPEAGPETGSGQASGLS